MAVLTKEYNMVYLITLVFLFNFCILNAQYETTRLKQIGEAIGIVNDSTRNELPINYDSICVFNNRLISLKTNSWGEISHIGYSLFPKEGRDSSLINIYNFVERYLLELDLQKNKSDFNGMLQKDEVLLNGNFPEILDEQSTEIEFSLDNVKYHQYGFNYRKGSKNIHMEFSPNCQLILGANDIELEDIFSRHFSKYACNEKDSIQYSLIIDKYGNRRDTISCSPSKIIEFFKNENGQIYYEKEDANSNVLFSINEELDYIHLAIIKDKYTYLYVFIPIHTYPEFFIKKIKKEI